MPNIREMLPVVLADLNPWWRDSDQRCQRDHPIRRDLQPKLLASLQREGDRRAFVILGPRQVGKSVLLGQVADDLLDEGLPPANLVRFDFDDWRLPRVPSITPEDVLALCPPGQPEGPRIFLLDEIQKFAEWDRWLKGAVDRGLGRIVATGSASTRLREGTRESGYGRWDDHRLETLSYDEFVRFNAREGETRAETLRRTPNLFERYLALGGFPEHAASTDFERCRQRIGRHVIERAIYRDLEPLGVDADAVSTLFTHLVRESGAIFNASARAQDMSCDPRSVQQWQRLLEDSLLVERLLRLTSKAGPSLRAMPKVHACDHGLALALAFGPRPNEDPEMRGRALEAMVYRHLRSATEHAMNRIFYFRRRDGLEADFVVLTEEGPIVVEVTASPMPSRKKSARLEEIGRILDASRLLLLHGGVAEEQKENLRLMPVSSFLLDPASILRGEEP